MSGVTGFPGATGSDDSYGILAQNKAMEENFKQFLARPENRPVLAAQQRKEMRQAFRNNNRMRAWEFKQKVTEAEYDAQKNIAPYLEYPVLRRVAMTLTNDAENDFTKWASNPRVIELFQRCKEMLDEGRMSEDEMEVVMVNMLKDPKTDGHDQFMKATKSEARVPTEHLVSALNEHLSERRDGNKKYQAGKLQEALKHYEAAKSVVEFVKGLSKADQDEVDKNRIAVYNNIAATYNALKEYGGAIEHCNKTLLLDPKNIKALLRRAKAFTGRHEYELAMDDLAKVKKIEPFNFEAEDEMRRLKQVMRIGAMEERALFGNMFDKPSKAASKEWLQA